MVFGIQGSHSILLGCLSNGPLEQVPKKETISCEGETWVGWGGGFQ